MSEEVSNQLGRYLREHREAAELTMRQLAALVGIDHAYIARLENGKQRNPSADVLQKVADALELDASELLAFIGVKPSSVLPAAQVYFRKKFGMSEAEAEEAAKLIEQYTNKSRGGEDEQS